ncbi:hypothetical protein J2S00_000760 [Caldalkalibacillus uzonensis]|uniref:Uncharacterized protein n=1 Tax=Caldalkalibacillus uzonensis TaxID=353224 RepID=A0ABU0CPA0_9BACI|nr:hypothetical protein [Caldalkalibacillus uzonensis]MDQ0337977.1 hypothetical protein [Caldalkalibacillus uzonensis]
MIYLFLMITATCLFLTFKLKKPLLLTVPFLTIFIYVTVQIAMVPLGFFETLKFIMSLR